MGFWLYYKWNLTHSWALYHLCDSFVITLLSQSFICVYLAKSSRHSSECNVNMFGSSTTEDRSTMHPMFDPNWGSNSWPSDHDSTCHVVSVAVLLHDMCQTTKFIRRENLDDYLRKSLPTCQHNFTSAKYLYNR